MRRVKFVLSQISSTDLLQKMVVFIFDDGALQNVQNYSIRYKALFKGCNKEDTSFYSPYNANHKIQI